MKNILFGITLAVLVIGIVCLRFSYTRDSNENWNPINVPFPRAGLVVKYPFYIDNGGRFEVQLSVSMVDDNTSVGMLPKPPIKSKLKVTIESFSSEKKIFRSTQYIEEFRNFGGGKSPRPYFFTGATIELPRKGNYTIEIVNENDDGIIDNCNNTCGIIELRRDEKLETGLLYGLLHALAYVLIVISIIGMAVIKVLENFKK